MSDDEKYTDIIVDKHETIEETEWLSLKRCHTRVEDEDGIREAPYIYAEETCSRGGIVISVLPFRRKEDGFEFLLREEHTPAWGDGRQISTLTGKVEYDEYPSTAAMRELYEESGYYVRDNSEQLRENHGPHSNGTILSLGQVFSNKAMNTRHFLYSFDLTDVPRKNPPQGDGTLHEDISKCVWKSSIHDSVDPLAYVSYCKLQKKGYLKG